MNTGEHDILLEMDRVSVFYRKRAGMFRREKFWALRDVSLDIRKGETLGVIGRNGAGKSTLLTLMAGIIGPDQGRIRFNGANVSLLSLQAGFTPHLSGRENAIFSGMLLGMRRRAVEARMDDIIAFSELADFIDEPIGTYSSGMKARLGFSVAFQANPDLLLVDEVIGVGDESFREKSIAAMTEKIRSNQTVVIVSHNLQLVKEVCDRAIWIHDGGVRSQGPPAEIIAQYQAFVRRPAPTTIRPAAPQQPPA